MTVCLFSGMFVAVAIKELNNQVFQTMVKVVRHYTMIAVAQQAGSFAITNRQVSLKICLATIRHIFA